MADRDELRRALGRPPSTIEPTGGFAAVAAVFGPGLDLLLVRRAEHPRDPWSGHLAFPGGRVEAGEDPLDAAIRETREEVDLALEPSWLVGRLDDLRTVGGRPGMVIRPFVFFAPELGDLRPNPAEIAGTLTVPLATLLAGEGRGAMDYVRGQATLRLPSVSLGDHRLWGLTLHMVDDLLHRLDGRGIGLDRPRGPLVR
jgi:8-oxo-dGTP pyrophosphatase MutT (NUDIX family)